MAITVTGLATTPVKGTRLREVERVELDRHGVRENRRFFLIDAEDRMVNSTHLGALQAIVSDYAIAERRLRLEFPDGRVLQEQVHLGREVVTRFYGDPVPARVVLGEWSETISSYVGQALRLVEADEVGAVDRRGAGAVSIVSRASLGRLADRAQQPSVDPRRFRMLIEVDGVEPHGEDRWVGQTIRVGDAVLRGGGHVGRCVITTRNPDSGEIDLQTLKVLGRYRRDADTTEPVAFGIYGEILEPGAIRVGDAVQVDG